MKARAAIAVITAFAAAYLMGSIFFQETDMQSRQPAGIDVSREEKTLSFTGEVRQREGWVQFLVYAQGYQWLEADCAIVSEVKLRDLQQAAASVDWEIWDAVWTENENVDGVGVTIHHDGKAYEPNDLTKAADHLGLVDTLFVGCPYFDSIALQETAADCTACPIFPLEQRALQDKFERASGESGYYLKEGEMPPVGSAVKVRIRFPE